MSVFSDYLAQVMGGPPQKRKYVPVPEPGPVPTPGGTPTPQDNVPTLLALFLSALQEGAVGTRDRRTPGATQLNTGDLADFNNELYGSPLAGLFGRGANVPGPVVIQRDSTPITTRETIESYLPPWDVRRRGI